MQHQLSKLVTILPVSTLIAFLISSCGSRYTGHSISKLQHDIDKPVRDGFYLNWHKDANDAEREMTLQMLLKVARTNELTLVAEEHELTKELNVFVSEFDRQVRKTMPGKFANIPIPEAIVYVDKKPNAAVTPVPVCLVGPTFEIEGGVATESKEKTIALTWEGKLESFPKGFPCHEKYIELDDQDEVMAWVHYQLGACSIEKIDFGHYKLSKDCQSKLAVPQQTDRLLLWVTSNVLLLSTGLLEKYSAGEFSYILAHELGHYYRSHASSSMDGRRFNFFYRQLQGKANEGYRPIPDRSLNEFGLKVRNLKLRYLQYRRVSDQKYPSEFFRPLKQIVRTIDAFQTCPKDLNLCNKSCRIAREWLESEDARDLREFPFDHLDDDGKKVYVQFEEKISKCIDSVHISIDSDDPRIEVGTAIHSARIRDAFANDLDIYKLISKDVESLTGNLGLAMTALNDAWISRLDAYLEPLRLANEMGLGFYTVEQEADEIALEWMSDLDLPLDAAPNASFKLAEFVESLRHRPGTDQLPGYIDIQRCRELRGNGWQDEVGNQVNIPISDFADLHHAPCFRIYNLDREIQAHGYELNEGMFSPELLEKWVKIPKKAEKFNLNQYKSNEINDLIYGLSASSSEMRPWDLDHVLTMNICPLSNFH